MDGVLHPSCVTFDYCCLLIREYVVLDCAQLFTLLKKHSEIPDTQRRKIELAICGRKYARKIRYADRTYLVAGPKVSLNKGRYKEQIICFWVLLDYIDKVDRHYATGTFSRISMEIGEKDYSIVHVSPGLERLCNSHMEQGGETRYFVIVDDPAQIPLIQGDRIHTFATVSKTGQIQYYER